MSGRSISESWILIDAMSTEPLCEGLVGKAIVLLVLKEEQAALLAADGNFFGEWLLVSTYNFWNKLEFLWRQLPMQFIPNH